MLTTEGVAPRKRRTEARSSAERSLSSSGDGGTMSREEGWRWSCSRAAAETEGGGGGEVSSAAATAADAVVTFSVGGLETAKGERRASAGWTAEKLKAAAARSAAAAEEESQRLALRGG